MADLFNPTVPAISMWQPFASLLFTWDRERGEMAKAFETRSFKLPARLIGQRVAVHATAKFPAAKHLSEELNDLCYQLWGCGYNYSLPFGAILGTVRFGAAGPTDEAAPFQPESEIAAGDWTLGRWAWPVLEAAPLVCPIPMKGKQGWWSVPAPMLDERAVAA
jgi:hypothetical protein